MTNESKISKDSELACPLGDLGEALQEASNFYRKRDDNGPNYRETTAWDKPEMAACRRVIETACGDEMVDQVCINGVCFKKLTMPPVLWQSARAKPDPFGGNRSHHHTTFILDGHQVHVDYICRSSSGPGSGVNEFQFFVDGKFVSRGGHAFTVPARIPRGEPAGMQWNHYLLICEKSISHWNVPHASWFTLWKRDRESGFTGSTASESPMTLFPIDQLNQSQEENASNDETGRFIIDGGVEIWIKSLEQYRTYADLMEGYPNRKLNDSILQRTLNKLRDRYGEAVVLIDPPMTPRPEKSMNSQGPWVELPSVRCIAELASRSVGEFESRLIVLWYQSDFAMPIDVQVTRKIKALNWRALAESIDDF